MTDEKRMKLAHIESPSSCPYRSNREHVDLIYDDLYICYKLSKGNYIFNCGINAWFPDECPLEDYEGEK